MPRKATRSRPRSIPRRLRRRPRGVRESVVKFVNNPRSFGMSAPRRGPGKRRAESEAPYRACRTTTLGRCLALFSSVAFFVWPGAAPQRAANRVSGARATDSEARCVDSEERARLPGRAILVRDAVQRPDAAAARVSRARAVTSAVTKSGDPWQQVDDEGRGDVRLRRTRCSRRHGGLYGLVPRRGTRGCIERRLRARSM